MEAHKPSETLTDMPVLIQEESDNSVDKRPAVEVDISDYSADSKCGLCHHGLIKNALEAGKLYRVSNKDHESFVHYFCMLFTAYSRQVGAENEGLFGFYGEEVQRQIEAARKKKCLYCSKTGATARCAKKKCNAQMHFTCGQSVGATFQFYGKMYVYCKQHRVRQKSESFPSPPDNDCIICYENVSLELKDYKRFKAPCCGRHFHRVCLQKYALSSGEEHFKCANCNDKTSIKKEVKRMGFYVPHKDADWEMNDNSEFYNYQDMYVQKRRCDMKTCLSPKGRDVSELDTEFEIVLCSLCGINGVHGKCGNINLKSAAQVNGFKCADCGGNLDMEERPSQRRSRLLPNAFAGTNPPSSVNNTIDLADMTVDSTHLVDLLDSSNDTSIDELLNSSNDDDNDVSQTDSLPDVNEFVKKFELKNMVKPSTNEADKSDLDIVEKVLDDHDRSLLDVNEFVKKFELKTGLVDSSVLLDSDTDNSMVVDQKEETLKENFLKSTEQVTKLLGDLKRHDEKNTHEEGKIVDKEVMEVDEASERNSELKDVSKEADLGPKTGIIISEQPSPIKFANSKIHIRTDIFENDMNDTENVVNLPEVAEDQRIEEEAFSSDSTFDISEKKRKFASILSNRAKAKSLVKKNDNYLVEFYRIVAPKKIEKSKPVIEKIHKTEKQVPDDPVAAVSNLKIVESFSVENMPESPVKEPVLKAKSPINITKSAISPKTSPRHESKIVAKSPAPRATTPKSLTPVPRTRPSPTTSSKETLVRTSSSSPSLPVITEDVEASSEIVDKASDDTSPPNQVDPAPSDLPKASNVSKSIPELPVTSPKPEVLTSKPETQQKEIPASKPYKPGPRSRTKPHIAPARMESKSVETTEVNLDASEPIEPVKGTSVTSVTSVTKNKEVPLQDMTEVSTEVPEPPIQNLDQAKEVIKYKPGPKSRKKYLVLKDNVDKNTTDMDVDNVKTVVGDNPKRKVDALDVMESEVNKKQKVAAESTKEIDEKKEDSIEAIQEFIQNTDTVMEVDAAPPNQEALAKRRAKRPYQCPVCEGFFRSEMVLQQHMAKIHFWNKLLALPKEISSGQWFQCSEFPCQYVHKMSVVVSGHLATEHKVVFRMALELFPNFSLPIPANPVMTIDDDEDDICVVESPVAAKTSLNNNNNIISALRSQVAPGSSFPLPSDTLLYPAPYNSHARHTALNRSLNNPVTTTL